MEKQLIELYTSFPIIHPDEGLEDIILASFIDTTNCIILEFNSE